MRRDPMPLVVSRKADGSAIYVTSDGDILDHICWRHYGQEWETPEAVLSANRGLADYGTTLPAGISVTLPFLSAPSPAKKERRRLFD